VSDALKGQDNPVWRLTQGLLLPRFIAEKFLIVSIPHLLFKEDPTTGMMVKVPNGTAVPTYKSILASCKLQFPNQVTITAPSRTANSKEKQDVYTTTLTSEAVAGVRAQIERAERMFCMLLSTLDGIDADALPTSKPEWMLFIDAGVTVLDLYATLAFGFNKGGGKMAQAYSTAINSTGRFDPSKLWPDDSEFRKR